MTTPKNLSEFIELIEKHDRLHRIQVEVDPYLEIAEIHRRVVSENGPALLFENVKGSPFKVATNLFGSSKRVEIALGGDPSSLIQNAVHFLQSPPTLKDIWKNRSLFKRFFHLGTKKRKKAPIFEEICTPATLSKLPILTSWPEDGGPFITLPLVYTESIHNSKLANLGMYRIQRFDDVTTGLHFQIGKGAGFHLHEAESINKNLPVAIFLRSPPALTLSAICPLPENVSELLFTS